MKDRILKFLQNENKSYAQFAEEIGVQPSGISHILSGRNNPSLDFILKMLSKYQGLSSEWLLFGRGSMYKTIIQPTLFDNEPQIIANIPEEPMNSPEIFESGRVNSKPFTQDIKPDSVKQFSDNTSRVLERVLFIYSDKTFTEYNPS
jgi:transcriptional regulator with XRE-family HTH domain